MIPTIFVLSKYRFIHVLHNILSFICISPAVKMMIKHSEILMLLSHQLFTIFHVETRMKKFQFKAIKLINFWVVFFIWWISIREDYIWFERFIQMIHKRWKIHKNPFSSSLILFKTLFAFFTTLFFKHFNVCLVRYTIL